MIVREQRRSPATAASVVAAIREFFADSRVDTGDYEHLVAEMSGDDPDDKQHMAAAIAGGATVLLTRNVRDFPAAPLAAHGLRVTDPDAYLCDLIDELPDEVAGTVIRLTAEKSRPPRTRADMLTHLRAAGVPRFAAILATMLEPGDA